MRAGGACATIRSLFILAAASCGHAAVTSYFVATTGSDGAPGTYQQPFATLGRAATAIAELRASSGGMLPGPVDVQIFGGTYFLNETLVITPESGGDANAQVAFLPFNNQAVVISGAAAVQGWSPLPGFTDVYQAPASSPTGFVRQMFATSGASPRRTLQQTATTSYTDITYSGSNEVSVVVAAGEVPFSPADLAHANIKLYHSWTSSINRLAAWFPANNTFVVGDSVGDSYNTASGNRYALMNVVNASYLQPGEFYYDPLAKVMVYRVLPGEATDMSFAIPQLPIVVQLVGNASARSFVTNFHLINLTIAHSDAALETQCLSDGCCGQSASDLSTAAVSISAAVSTSLTGVEIAHTGGYGLWIRGASTQVAVSHCWLHDLGAGGVRVGEPNSGVAAPGTLTTNITLSDSVLEYGGVIVEAGAGILLQQAADSYLIHNSIHDFAYTGISTGWTWGYAPTSNVNLYVGFNEIYNIGLGRLSDMGCIYNLGISPGTSFFNNICHDVESYGYGGWGYYDDEGTSSVVWTNNIVYNTKSAGFHQHYGLGNTIIYNVIAFPTLEACTVPNCDEAAVRSSQHTPGSGPGAFSSFTFYRNIVLLRNASSTLFFTTIPTAMANVTLGSNVYWSTAVPAASLQFPPTQAPVTWSQWQAEGKDYASVVADPQFVNAGGYDFSDLSPTSPALALGFQPIDTSTVGPRPQAQVRVQIRERRLTKF